MGRALTIRRWILIASPVLLIANTPPRRTLEIPARASIGVGVHRSPRPFSTVDAYVVQQAARDNFSGVVAVARNGVLVYQRAVGSANRARRVGMTVNTRLQIASITKIFTEIAILQLEQAGRLSLSDTVGAFLPDYPNVTVRSKVTIDQLLHHRSGIGSFWNPAFMAQQERVHTVGDYLALFDHDSLMFAPGAKEEYSNGGYVVLGAIIERVSGESYHDYVRRHIFEPAGMTSTVPYDNRRVVANAAIGYTSQSLDAPPPGDARHAGAGGRPGYDPQQAPGTVIVHGGSADRSADATPTQGMRLRIIGADGKELSPEAAEKAVAAHEANTGMRQPNTATEAGTSGPAGDDYSTAADLVRFAHALASRQLLDETRTDAVLGRQYHAGGDFHIAGGGPGVNAELSISPSGYVVVVLSNYDPPAATSVAQFIHSVLADTLPPRSR